MKRIFTVTIVIIIFSVNFKAQIISQYIDTDSGTKPKGIEIWNNTGGTLDFSSDTLIIKQGTNGATASEKYTIDKGTLADGEVIVIGTLDTVNTSYDLYTTSLTNESAFFECRFTFNGDDALEIWCGGMLTDIFGISGSDPGYYWSSDDVSTANQNIELINGITNGSSTGWENPSIRFKTVNTTPTAEGGTEGFGIAPIRTTTSIIQNNNTTNNITVYPNPFANQLGITSTHTIKSIKIFNSIGQLVKKIYAIGTTETIISTSDLSHGIYIIKITDANEYITTKKAIKR